MPVFPSYRNQSIDLHAFCTFLLLCPYLELFQSVFSPNAGKYGPEKLQVRTLFTQGTLRFFFFFFHRNQEATIKRILRAGFWVYSCQFFMFVFFEKVVFALVSIYSHASFFNFLAYNFCIQEAAESRTITVCLLNMVSENRSTIPIFYYQFNQKNLTKKSSI